MSENPAVAMFHDFLSDKECERLMEKGRNKMKATPLAIGESKYNRDNKNATRKVGGDFVATFEVNNIPIV